MSTQSNNYLDKLVSWLKNSITIKLMIIGFLILILQIPLTMVNGLISERQYRQNEVSNEISSLWGGKATVTPYILTIPYLEFKSVSRKVGDKEEIEIIKQKKFVHFLPKDVKISGTIESDIRYRSIYEVAVYESALNLIALFEKPKLEPLGIDDDRIIWEEIHINLGISELKGISDPGLLKVGQDLYEFDPGIPSGQNISSGIHAYIDLKKVDENFEVTFDLNLKGSQNLSFTPLGEKTIVELNSTWQDPSFNGAFIPTESKIDDNGFTASWNISHLNRNYPQIIKAHQYDIFESEFGVDFILSVNNYMQVHRASKYGIMFISLIFLIFFFMQVLKKVKMHGIQYLLIGMAICVFFTLLIALSEHLGFAGAYWISCTASSMMIAIYSLSFLKNMNFALIVLITLFSFFGYMFIAIQMQDLALLFGSIGLFVILGTVMFFSRKLNWNQSSSNTV